MEEKNKLIIAYIENKVKELEEMSMYIHRENIDKLLAVFLNREEDITAIKAKIDDIFRNSIAEYQKSLDSMGNTYEEVLNAYQKIEKMNRTSAKVYLRGGIVPYVL